MWRTFRPALPSEAAIVWALGTQFTCFTSTKVHILMQKALLVPLLVALSWIRFTCFTSTKVHILMQKALLVPLLVALSWIRTLDTLAPFSGVALALIFSGLLAVAWY